MRTVFFGGKVYDGSLPLKEAFIVEDGERVCQMVIARHETVEWEPCTQLDETERGAGGFGHTGKK